MRFRRHLIGILAAAAILAPSLVSADATSAKWYDKLSVGGFAGADYQVWLNQPSAYGVQQVTNRVFDKIPNIMDYSGEMTFNYADKDSNTGAVVDLLYGGLGQVVTGGGTWPSIGQSYLSQAFGPLTVDLGKFTLPFGYETWNPTANANFSRSLTYSLEPLFQTGAKLDYAGPAGITANLWFDNGNSMDPYNNTGNDNSKGYGVALGYAGIKNLALNAKFYLNQQGLHVPSGYFDSNDMIDVNAAYTLSTLTFAAEYLYDTMVDGNPATGATLFSPKINAVALYATYVTPINNLSVSGRAEQVNAPDSKGLVTHTTGGNTVNLATQNLTMDSYTGTVKYVMGPVTDILEYRADASNGYDFASNGTPGASKTQIDQTVTIAATYGF